MSLISLIPEILVEVGIGDFLYRLNIVDGVDAAVVVVHVNANFLESTLRKQEALDTCKCRSRRVVSLLDESKLFSLVLIQTTLDGVCFSQSFQGQNQDLGVVLVRYSWEGYWRVLPRFEPMDCRCVDGHGFFRRDIRTIFHIIVLALLFRFQPQSCETAEVFLRDGLVNSSTSPDTLSIVVCYRDPPVGLALDIPQNDIFDRRRQSRYLPRYVTLPTPPGFR